jgi:hypothetical protein
MKCDYVDLKEELRSIKIEAGSDCIQQISQAETINKLYENIEKMEEFQKILLVGIQDRLHMRWPQTTKEEGSGMKELHDEPQGSSKNAVRFLKNALEFLKTTAVQFWRKAEMILEYSQAETDVTLPINNLPLELSGLICHFFLRKSSEEFKLFCTQSSHTKNIIPNFFK